APEVPTASEAGYPALTFEGSVGLFGWRDMPAYVGERIVRDVQTVAADPAFRSRLIAGGTVSRSGTSEEFAAAIEEQRKKMAVIHPACQKPAKKKRVFDGTRTAWKRWPIRSWKSSRLIPRRSPQSPSGGVRRAGGGARPPFRLSGATATCARNCCAPSN